jgi:glutathione S-transferase
MYQSWPWAYRYYIFEHYQGPFAIPLNDPVLHAHECWYDFVFNIDSVKRTLPDKNKYLEHIGKYADASARSKVSNAVRRGVVAHEIEDLKDTY